MDEDMDNLSKQVGDTSNTQMDVEHASEQATNTSSMLGFGLSDDFMNKVVNNKSDGPNFSILDKVRSRLFGGNQEQSHLDDTQKIDLRDSSTQEEEPLATQFQHLPQLDVDESEYNQSTQVTDTKNLGKKNLHPTQVLQRELEPTQVIKKSSALKPTQVVENVNTEFESAPATDATQVIQRNDLQSLFVESEEEEEEEPMTAEERQRQIAQLAEEKKQARLQNERELLEQDITKGSLTDEEDELNHEANDTVVSSHMKSDGLSTKELEKAQEFINIQKRHIDIRPDFERKQVFTKEKFLDLFSEDEDEDEEMFGSVKKTTRVEKPSSPTMDEVLRSSPTTSPVKDHVFDLFQVPSKPTQPSNPLEVYAQRLKQNLPSSPSNENDGKEPVINLDSDSDIEIGQSSSPLRTQHKPRFSNHAKELDVIPELTKEQKFLIRQRFAKKKYQNSKRNAKDTDKHKQQSNFFKQLRKRNIDQLKIHKMNDPEHALMEELEKDEESMSSLLEREMERVRKIRKKEKLQERAKLALLGKKLGMKMVESEDDGNNDDVPDSDDGSAVPDSDYNSDAQEGAYGAREEEEEEEEEEIKEEEGEINPSFDDDEAEEHLVTHDDDSHELFQNLQPREQDESFVSTQGDVHVKREPNLPLFKDLTQTQSQSHTQADQPTQVDNSILGDLETQVIEKGDATQADMREHTIIEEDEDDDDDLITPARVNKGRKALRNKMLQIKEEPTQEQPDEADDADEDDDPAVIQQKIKEFEQKIRRQELQARKRRKELEKSGAKTMFDREAEESEDEWKGLGGLDGEVSDVANSEDERMIDNNLNIDLQNDEIRKKFMKDYQIKDQQELEKLLDDIKNHKLIKRVGANNHGLDIELSDEEDQLLAAYRKQKLLEQQQRLLQNKKLQALSKDEKSKAFFDTIQDKHEVIVIDSDSDVEALSGNPFVGGNASDAKSKEQTPVENVVENNNEDEDADSFEKEAPLKHTIKIEESFVHNKLSFLYQSVYDDDDDGDRGYNRIQRLSKLQHGISDDEDDSIDDINALKSKSILQPNRQVSNIDHRKLTKKRKLDQDTPTDVDENKQDGGDTDKDDDKDDDDDDQLNLDVVDNGDDDDEDEFMPIFKRPSITKSFKSFQEQKGITFNKQGKQQFSGVTVSKQYKVVSGSKASITYMSSKLQQQQKRNQSVKSLKERQIEQSLHSLHKSKSMNGSGGGDKSTSLKLFSSSDFL